MAENELPIIKLPAKNIVSSGGSFESDFKFTDDDLNKLLARINYGYRHEVWRLHLNNRSI